MLHKVKCPRCGVRGQVEREHPNPKIRCPGCQAKYRAVSLEVLEEGTVPPRPARPATSAPRAKASSRGTARVAPVERTPAPPPAARPVPPPRPAAVQATPSSRPRASDIRKYGRLGRPRGGDGPVAWVKRGIRDGLASFPILFLAMVIAGLLSGASTLVFGIGYFIVSPAMVCGVWAVVIAIARSQPGKLEALFSGFSVLGPAIVMGLISSITATALSYVIIALFISTLLKPALLLVFGALALGLLYVFLRLVFAYPLIVDRKLPIGAALSASFRMTAGLDYWIFLAVWAVATGLVSAALVGLTIAAIGSLGIVPGILIGFLAWAADTAAGAVPFGHAYDSLVKKLPGDARPAAGGVASV
ncbi:MAG: hypothetical protein JXP34_18450 [Planctomycetes bacterium]|nr:hypothetical protein [Planctomycetota bacterium]